ncbi:MAG: HDIG domain-containing protein [Porphyromonas sp.]|nr:HDIG domain-containing protein [Porphyromonas sp.]
MLNSFSWQESKSKIIKIAIFFLVAVAITFLIPLKRNSRYQYVNDKPWQGALLTAPYDFPIYKTEEQLKEERDSLQAHLYPVYSHQRDVDLLMMQELQDQYHAQLNEVVPKEYFAYLNEQLQRAYSQGIIGLNALKELRTQHKLEVLLLSEGNELTRTPITKFRTLKEVHEHILKELPSNLDPQLLNKMEPEHYLRENIVYNKEMSEQLYQEALSNISPSLGMIQMGQRIIDKGEIVTPYTYNLLRSLEIEYEKRSGGTLQHYQTRIGLFIIASIALVLLALYLTFLVSSYTPTFKNNILILSSIATFVVITSIVSYFGLFSIYMVPYVMIIFLLRTFIDGDTSHLSYVVAILLSALFVTEPLSFIVIQLLAGLTALVCLQGLNNRAQMIKAAFYVYLVYSVAYLGMFFITDGKFTSDYLKIQLIFGVNLIFLTFTYMLCSIVERLFGYVSKVSLVELSDINTPLLKELSERAAGTFQHSMQVSMLAAEAADSIGADVQLIRAGALYHDIGKIKNPAYFTENQGARNPHDLLPQLESAQIIIRHVSDGIALAQKHNLPPQIIDFIRTHHSDSLVRYFYNTYCNLHPDLEVNEVDFRYPGPRPFTREQGILMLADAVEASSRSLKEYSAEVITEHVQRIVDNIAREGHLNNTPLSFRDIQTIKEVFIAKLKTIYHSRISYPELKTS